MNNKAFDLIIIGGGPAGLTAAIYGARAGLSTLLIEKTTAGGQMTLTNVVENYPGVKSIDGFSLAQTMFQQAKEFGANTVTDEVVSVSLKGKTKKIVTTKHTYSAKAVILCMGASARKLGLPNESRLVGYGVSYCVTCDAALYKGSDIAIVGGGNTAVEDCIYAAGFMNKVYLIHRRDELRASKVYVDAMLKLPNVEVVYDSVVEEIVGDKFVEGLNIKNVKTQQTRQLKIDGLFVAVGHIPNSTLVRDIVKCDENGYILTKPDMSTSIKGVYSAGDINKKLLRQIVTAAADGMIAAESAGVYLNLNKK